MIRESVLTKVTLVETHRFDVAKARILLAEAMDDLAKAIRGRHELEATVYKLTADDKDMARRIRLLKVVSLPSLIVAIKDGSLAMRTLFGLERQAFGLADVEDPTLPAIADDYVSPSEAAIKALKERMRQRNSVNELERSGSATG